MNEFEIPNLIPKSIRIAGDGYGNSWVLDVDAEGDWGSVFYVGHSPAVIVKQADSLTGFLEQLHEYGKDPRKSNIGLVHEIVVNDIWNREDGLVTRDDASYSEDVELADFARRLPHYYMLGDLRFSEVGSGFAWGKFSTDPRGIIRFKEGYLWGSRRKLPGRVASAVAAVASAAAVTVEEAATAAAIAVAVAMAAVETAAVATAAAVTVAVAADTAAVETVEAAAVMAAAETAAMVTVAAEVDMIAAVAVATNAVAAVMTVAAVAVVTIAATVADMAVVTVAATIEAAIAEASIETKTLAAAKNAISTDNQRLSKY